MKPCQQRRQREIYGEAIRERSAPALTEPPSSYQSRALIKSTLNSLSVSSSSGLEELLLERRERLVESNAAPQALSKGARTAAIVMLAIEKELGDNAKAAG